MKALNNYVILKRDKAQDKIGSIVLPESVKDVPVVGEVVAMGANVGYQDGIDVSDFDVGNRVIYKKYAAIEIEVNNEEFVVVKDEDILCVL